MPNPVRPPRMPAISVAGATAERWKPSVSATPSTMKGEYASARVYPAAATCAVACRSASGELNSAATPYSAPLAALRMVRLACLFLVHQLAHFGDGNHRQIPAEQQEERQEQPDGSNICCPVP